MDYREREYERIRFREKIRRRKTEEIGAGVGGIGLAAVVLEGKHMKEEVVYKSSQGWGVSSFDCFKDGASYFGRSGMRDGDRVDESHRRWTTHKRTNRSGIPFAAQPPRTYPLDHGSAMYVNGNGYAANGWPTGGYGA
jgi:hypothetical protein